MSFPLPTMLIAPGGYCPASLYDPFISTLKSHGLTARAVPLATVGRRPPREPLARMYDDADALATEARKLADEGKYVILLGHSYGGMVVTQCTKDLGVKERKAAGKAGGVVRLIYLAGLVPRIGFTCDGTKRERVELGDIDLAEEGIYTKYTTVDPETAAVSTLNDVPIETARVWAQNTAEMSAVVKLDPLTWAAYKDVPATYIVTKQDRSLSVGIQEGFIEVLREFAPDAGEGVEVLEIDTGHAPMATKPEELAQMLVGVAKRA